MAFSDAIGFLGEEDVVKLNALLEGYIRESNVECALLCDRTGRLLTAQGDT